MTHKMGRPKSENPKAVNTRIRMDEATSEKLKWCAEQKGTTKSSIIREGIALVAERIQGQENK